MKSTYMPNPTKVKQDWHQIDAGGRILGKVASEAAKLLIGKHKPEYTPNMYLGDKVVITNAEKIAVTGKKMKNKIYYRHTNYPGGLRAETLEMVMKKNPSEAVRKAVKGMLPNNKLRKKMLASLYIYNGEEHPHHGQVSEEGK